MADEHATRHAEGAVLGPILWVAFTVGALLAFLTGLVAFLRGHAADRRAGRLGVGWFLFAVLAIAVARRDRLLGSRVSRRERP